jgi:uncharacterized protein
VHDLVPRKAESVVFRYLDQFPVVAIVGSRQAGKSTLARLVLSHISSSFSLDLELPSDALRLTDSEAFLRHNSRRLVCIDEVQRSAGLFPVLRALVDEDRRPGRYLILGSASPELLRTSSESLAGRIAYIELTPFTIEEVALDSLREHWFRGGYPESYLAPSDEYSFRWRQQFIRTYLDADLPALGIELSRPAMERFWRLIASSTGSVLNKAKLTEPVGVSAHTLTRYIDILESTYMVRILRPKWGSTRKRLVKSPKVYIRDTGLIHALLGIEDVNRLFGDVAIGPSWESYVVEQLCAAFPSWEHSFYRTSAGAEVDLVLEHGERVVAVEAKASTAPRVTRGFHDACSDIGATERYIVAPIPGNESYPYDARTRVASPNVAISLIRDGVA